MKIRCSVLALLFSAFLLFLCGCIDVIDSGNETGVVCEGKYMRHGTGCCLDADSNGICDSDEGASVPVNGTASTQASKQSKTTVASTTSTSLKKAAASAGVSLPFTDNFNSESYSKRYWDTRSFAKNSFAVLEGVLTYVIDGKVPDTLYAGGRFIGLPVDARNYVIDVKLKNAKDAGIVVRARNYSSGSALNGPTFIYKPRNYAWGTKFPGEAYWIWSQPAVEGGWGDVLEKSKKGTLEEGVDVNLRIVVNENKYTAYVNGEESASYTDDSGAEDDVSRTWVGLYMYFTNQSFEDFRITTIEDAGDLQSSGLSPGGVDLPFYDNFSSAEYTKKYWADWGFGKNSFGVTGGKLAYLIEGKIPSTQYVGGRFVGVKVNAVDYEVEVDLANSQDAGILMRGEEQTYYGAIGGLTFIYRPHVQVYGVTYPGESYWIRSTPAAQGGWGDVLLECDKGTLSEGSNVKLKIKVEGNKYTAYVNGQVWCSYTDDSGDEKDEERKWIGLYMYRTGQSFDNFKVTAL